MKRILLSALAGTALLMSAYAPASAQNTNYPGMCTGYPTSGECLRCCARLAKGNSDCTNACGVANPNASNAKAMMSPKRK